MSRRQCYESRIADLKPKSRWQSAHHQAAHHDNGEPDSTDNDSISPDRAATPLHSAMNVFKNLKVGQAGLIWGSDGTLLGKARDDDLGNPAELEGYPVNEKGEVLDEDGLKIGQALSHETYADTRVTGPREHSFYKTKPDQSGWYHCPFVVLDQCGYRPQKLKSNFDKHLDSHLGPDRCDIGECEDTQFLSTGCLLRHKSGVHKRRGLGAEAYVVHNDNGVEQSEKTLQSSFPKGSSHRGAATQTVHEPPENPQVCSFQGCDCPLCNEYGHEEDVSEHEEGAHVPLRPAIMYHKTLSSESNDNVGKKPFEFFDKHHKVKRPITLEPRYHPKPTTIPTSIHPEQQKQATKESNEKILVGVDLLHKLESKICDLQARVEECEGSPTSSTNSSIADSEDSVDSIYDLGYKGGPAARYSQDVDDDIIIYEPEVQGGKRGTKIVEGPSLKIARWNHFCENGRLEAVGVSTPPIAKFPAHRPLLTVVSEYDRNQLWRKRVEIDSPAFFDLLKEVSRHNISELALHEGVFHLVEPFIVLFLNRKQLRDYVNETNESTQAKEHAEFILNFLTCEFGETSRVLDNFESATPPNLIQYRDLWMLYRPGTTVYSRTDGEWEAFVIDSLDGMQIRRPSPDNCHSLTRLDIRVWSMNFDGEVYGRVWSIHCVAPFHGVRDINSLPLVPEKFLLDRKAIRETLLSRGKKFCTFKMQHCQGSANSPSQSTRVMVDHLTYQKHNGWLISIDGKYGPSSAKQRSWKGDRYSDWDEAFDRRPRRYTPQRSLVHHFEDEYWSRDYEPESIDKHEETQAEPCLIYSTDRPSHVVVRDLEKYDLIRPDAEMDELALMLCPQHVRGFCFRDKVWQCFNVSQLKPVCFQENAWDHLVLDEEYKDVLETVVSSHVDKVAGLRDSAGEKGLSILLHGGPGVGKTLTAESIAEHFGKPLFPVTCSDFGTSVARFEEKLEEIADYATKWGAILLFDEADVLLQARRDYEYVNLKRNDLVSSFVRFIEYYQGIVFITTNRVRRFDEGLMPRIDITLGLPPLDRGRRVGIWHHQIRDLFDEGTINAAQSADLRMLAQQKWSMHDINGHQIKKVVKIAKVLARKKGKMLGYREVEIMLKMEREFEERADLSEKEKEKRAGKKEDNEDFEGFEKVEKP